MADKEIIQVEIQTGNSVRNLEQMRAGITGLTGALATVERYSKSSASDLMSEYNRIQTSLKKVSDELQRYQRLMINTARPVEATASKMRELSGRLDQLGKEYNQLAAAAQRSKLAMELGSSRSYKQAQEYNELIKESTRNYMKHYEMISKNAGKRTFATAPIAAMTSTSQDIKDLNAYYSALENVDRMSAKVAASNAAMAASRAGAVAKITAPNVDLQEMNAHYRQLEMMDVAAAVQRMSATEAAEKAGYEKRQASAIKEAQARIDEQKRREVEYTAWWERELGKRAAAVAKVRMSKFEQSSASASATPNAVRAQVARLTEQTQESFRNNMFYKVMEDLDRFNASASERIQQAVANITAPKQGVADMNAYYRDLEAKEVASAVKRMREAESIEKASYDKRRDDAIRSARERIEAEKALERAYTAWWETELKKRGDVQYARAQMRSNRQRFSPEMLTAGLIAPAQGTSELSRYYQQITGQNGVGGSALAFAENAVASAAGAEKMQAALTATTVASTKAGNAVGRLGGKVKDAERISAAFADIMDRKRTAIRGVAGALGGLWLTYTKYIGVMLAATAATKAAQESFTQGAELNYQSRFAAILSNDGPAPEEQIKNIKKELISVTDGTQFSALEAASGLRILAQTGVKAQDGLGMLNTIMKATVFGESDMKTTTEGLTAAMYNFNLMGDDAVQNAANMAKVGDAMAYVSVQTKAGMNDVAESFKNMQGIASRYGGTIEEVSVILERIGKKGLVGGMAGTRARNMIEDLLGTPNNKKAADIKKQLGIENFNPGTDDVLGYIDKVIAKYKELDTEGRQLFDANLMNERGRLVFSALIDGTESLTDALLKMQEKSEGILDNLMSGLDGDVKIAFATMASDFSNAFAQAIDGSEDNLLDLAKTLGDIARSDEFRGFLKDMVTGLTDFAHLILDNTDKLKMMFAAFVAFKATGALASIVMGITDLRGIMKGFGPGFTAGAGSVSKLTSAFELLAQVLGAGTLSRVLALLAAHPVIGIGITVTAAAVASGLVSVRDSEDPDGRKAVERDIAKEAGIGELKTMTVEQLKDSSKKLADIQAKLDETYANFDGMLAKGQWSDPRQMALKNLGRGVSAELEVKSETARMLGKAETMKPAPVPVKEEPKKTLKGFGGGGGARYDRSIRDRVESARKQAEAEYQAAVYSVEFYEKGLELRKERLTGGEAEYDELQGHLADMRVQFAIEREQKVQGAINAELAKGASGSNREQLETMLKESEAKKTQIQQKAMVDSAYRQLKFEEDKRKRTEQLQNEIASLENAFNKSSLDREEQYYGRRTRNLDRFIDDWKENEGKLLQRAQINGDDTLVGQLINQYERELKQIQRIADPANGYTKGMAMTDTVADAGGDLNGAQYAKEASIQRMLELDQAYYDSLDQLRQKDILKQGEYDAMREAHQSALQQRLLEIEIESANQRLEAGTGTFEDAIMSSLGRVTEGFVNFGSNTSSLMGDFFTSMTDGFANSLGRAIVYAEDLNTALLDVARQALSQLISGLIKVGVQFIIQKALGSTLQTTMAAESAATAASVAASWAGAAASVSLASFGANAAPAMAGIAATHALSSSLTNFAGAFDEGGRIPAGKWGIVGEVGPEIVNGPVDVTSRKTTADILGSTERNRPTEPVVVKPQMNNKIINVLDKSLLGEFLATDEGESAVMNIIQRNQSVL